MPNRGRRKPEYSSPRKGTKSRAMVNLMLRCEGATAEDFVAVGVKPGGGNIISTLERLRNDQGFDIAAFPEPQQARGRPRYRWKIIGRFIKSGGYRSFIRFVGDDND